MAEHDVFTCVWLEEIMTISGLWTAFAFGSFLFCNDLTVLPASL